MSFKFNCSNPECRQRVEVDDAMAGADMLCPACGSELHAPSSHDIRFNCSNRDCQQHIIVDVSEAGRAVRCPSCGKVSRVPGDPPKPLIPQKAWSACKLDETVETDPENGWRVPAKRLLAGWGMGAMIFGLLMVVFHLMAAASLPENLDKIAEEIHLQYYPELYQPPKDPVYSREVQVVECVATNAAGTEFKYFYVPPAELEPGRRYPVVVDQSSSIKNRRMRDIQFLANAGIYYVSPNEYGITNWGVVPEMGNTLAVLSELTGNPNVDSNRFYVMGQSATTGAAVSLVNAYPEKWRGLLLMEPGGAFPHVPFESERVPSVYISHGMDDRHNQGPLGRPGLAERFLLKASAHLVPTRIDYQKGDHGYPPEQLKLAYISAVKFIYSDY